MFIILIIVLIPSIDMLHMGLAYACGWYANHLAVREAACSGPTKWQAAADNATNAWLASPLGVFVRATSVKNVPTPMGSVDPTTNLNKEVQVQTTITLKPMFQVPFITGQTVTFTYTGIRPLEETGLQ
jgi:hypothetical protein